MDVVLKDGERIDDLERNNYRIIQNPKGFCFGVDAVFLSGFARVKQGERAIDLGTGTGILPILLTAKTEGEHFTGLEIQEESADMARRSVMLNDLQQKVEIVTGDIKEAVQIFGAASFGVVTANPPYMPVQHGLQNFDKAKLIARHEVMCSLEDVVKSAAGLLIDRGRFYMVHRPFRLSSIMDNLHRYGLEPKRMRFVHPFAGKEANLVLIEAVKGGGVNLKLEAPLVVYEKQGVYTEEVHCLYGF